MIRHRLSRVVFSALLLWAISVGSRAHAAGATTIYKPVRAGNIGALFHFEAACSEGCPHMWCRVYEKVDGDWQLHSQFGTGSGNVSFDIALWEGKYRVDLACHSTTMDVPESGWATCAYLVAYWADLQVRRKGTADAFGNTATVAAGGKDSDVHKAEIQVTANPPIAGIPVNVFIQEGTGQGKEGTGGPATLEIGNTTDCNGKITGTLTSSNKTEEVHLQVHPTDEAFNSEVRIYQEWDHQNGGEWQYEPYFIPNAPSDVSWTLEIADGVPITGHTAKFYAQRVVYYEWDDVLLDYVRYEEERCPANNCDLSFYSDFTPAQTQDSGDGVYSSQQTVYEDDENFDWFVDEVEFRGVDDDTYVR